MNCKNTNLFANNEIFAPRNVNQKSILQLCRINFSTNQQKLVYLQIHFLKNYCQ